MLYNKQKKLFIREEVSKKTSTGLDAETINQLNNLLEILDKTEDALNKIKKQNADLFKQVAELENQRKTQIDSIQKFVEKRDELVGIIRMLKNFTVEIKKGPKYQQIRISWKDLKNDIIPKLNKKAVEIIEQAEMMQKKAKEAETAVKALITYNIKEGFVDFFKKIWDSFVKFLENFTNTLDSFKDNLEYVADYFLNNIEE